MVAIEISSHNSTPIAQQIIEGIRSQIILGNLKPGEQLPTVRQIGLQLGVHFNTVASAYRELEKEGWLVVGRKKGTFVLDRDPPILDSDEKIRLNTLFLKEVETVVNKFIGLGLKKSDLKKMILKRYQIQE